MRQAKQLFFRVLGTVLMRALVEGVGTGCGCLVCYLVVGFDLGVMAPWSSRGFLCGAWLVGFDLGTWWPADRGGTV